MTNFFREITDGAFGAGLVLIVLPGLALYFGIYDISTHAGVGLPILAIFGIMMLFGALSLVASVFVKLNLSDKTQPLALPEGSIRAVIAMALIVLFAIIAIMLYTSLSEPYPIPNLTLSTRDNVLTEMKNRVIAIQSEPCTPQPPVDAASKPLKSTLYSSDSHCKDENKRFTVILRVPPGQETTDLAKQLLILIGTLMTSLTSFYFASRTGVNQPQPPAEPSGSVKNMTPNPALVSPKVITFKDGVAFSILIGGTSMENVKEVSLKQGESIVKATKTAVGKDGIDCTFVAEAGTPEGVWQPVVTALSGIMVSPKDSVKLNRAV